MRPIEIIAEAGINHNGDMETAKKLIHEAKKAGADVIKFQLYDPRKRPDIEQHPWKDIVLQSRLTKRQLYFLDQECDRADIEFMCSVFDVERVGWLEEIGVKRYKIASKSIHDKELAEAITATGKPVIVSYGMRESGKETWIDKLTWEKDMSTSLKCLYCVSNYPTALSDIDFYDNDGYSIFDSLAHGFSDHTVGITVSIVAMSLGARIIEKHFTTSRVLSGPDHLLSCEPDELRQLCSFRDDIERILYKE